MKLTLLNGQDGLQRSSLTSPLVIRALKEPVGGTKRQENLEKGGNHHIDETISIVPYMGHRAVAKDLSGMLMRTWNLPALWATVPMAPILSTAQRRQLCGRTPGR